MQKILIVSIQRADKTVGGMSYRFMALWEYLQAQKNVEVHLLCTQTLWDKVVNKPLEDFRGQVSIMNDRSFYKPKALFLWLRVLIIILKKGIKSIHIAGGQHLLIPIYKLDKLFGAKTIITFASNSIKMAAYNNPAAEKRWHLILKNVKEIDVLNPTYDLPDYGFKVNVSPCSFPFHIYENGKRIIPPAIGVKEDLILFVGALAQTKNPILAIEGFTKFKTENQNAYKLILIGKGPMKEELENLIEQANKDIGSDCIELIHGLPSKEIYALMRKSKIFLSLQDYDNYPSQSLMEAMIYGNAIVATSDGDTKKLVKEEFGNIIIQNKIELSTALKRISSQSFDHRYNQNFILNEFTLERFSKYFLAIHSATS